MRKFLIGGLLSLVVATSVGYSQSRSSGSGGGSGSGAAGANQALSNLTSPTAINQSLLPGSDNSINLGSSSLRYANVFSLLMSSGVSGLNLRSGDRTGNASPSGSVQVISGDSSGDSNTGDISLLVGTPGGSGTRGGIYLLDGTEGTSGECWVSDGTAGKGKWDTCPGSSGANATLSNLTAPTAINENLIGATGTTFSILTATEASGVASEAMILQTAGTSGNASSGSLVATSGSVAGSSASGLASFGSGDSVSTGNTGSVNVKSGNSSGGNSGSLSLTIGTAGGSRGKIKFVDGSEGAAGECWVSTGTLGEGNWDTCPASATAFNDLADATGSGTVDNAANAQTWTWNTIGSGTALTASTTHTTFTGALLALTATGNNSGSTGNVASFTTTGSSNRAIPLNISTSNTTNGLSGLRVAATGTTGDNYAIHASNASAGNIRTIFVDNTNAASGGTGIRINNASTSGAQGLTILMTGTTGSQTSASLNNASALNTVTNFDLNLTDASAAGTNARFNHYGSSGINLELNSAGATGSRDVLRIKNGSTATTNNGAVIQFNNLRTTGGATDMAAIEGRITDIGNAQYKGALILKTSNNAAPAERMKIDYAGHVIYSGTTAPSITANCGTTPSVAGNDVVGRITVGSGGTDVACTLTFGIAYTTAPVCVCNDETTALLLTCAASTTTLVITSATPFGAADKIVYNCAGY